MKVVQIVTQMEAAGAQKVAHLLHEGLKTQVDSELWFLYTKRPAYAEQRGVKSLLNHPPRPAEYAVIAARLYRWLREAAPDTVITHTHYANVLGQAIARAAGVPRRIAVHHNPLSTYPRAARALDLWHGQAGTYSEVVCVSDAVETTLCSRPDRYRKLLTRIHNGIDFPRRDRTLDVRGRWSIPRDKPLLITVGRLSKQKNHALLLRALREIPDVHLAIVGAGELWDRLNALASELGIAHRVHFTGELASETVASFLHASDVFVFPSLWEGLPMAAIEALYAGAAIVASDIPATREVVGDAALLVPPGDAPVLAAAIKLVLRDSVLAQNLRARARQQAIHFTASRMVERYSRLILGEERVPADTRQIMAGHR